VAAWLPVLLQADTGNLRATPAPGDWASPNRKRENIGSSHAPDATHAGRTDRRRDGAAARDVRRMPPSSHFANSGDACASQEHFSCGDHFVPPSS